jgi:glyoxylase-like metal-dependent hydrolase (beta-lactamase superfamily II)
MGRRRASAVSRQASAVERRGRADVRGPPSPPIVETMSALGYQIIDGDFPVGSKNKTATLVLGDDEAMLVDTGFTRADGHRLAAAVLDSGKTLTKIVVSHSDPDFYWGAEVLADAFPVAEILATPEVIAAIKAKYEGKLQAWAAVGANRPTRLVAMKPLTGDIEFAGHHFELMGAVPVMPDRTFFFEPASRTILGGVLVFSSEHVWIADTPRDDQLDAWTGLLDRMAALEPVLVVPGHRLPGALADVSAVHFTKDYIATFRDVVAASPDAASATTELIERYPDAGMRIAAELGPKVVKGEMKWG